MISMVSHYQNNQVVTSSPEKITLMLYDGAVNFSKIALDKMKKGDIGGKGVFIGKAQAIVAELMNTLNHEVGGEITRRLEQLYLFVIDEYINANIQNSEKALENAIRIITYMRDTWEEAIRVWRLEGSAADGREQDRTMYAGVAR
jgi:flagellar protein FliS